MSFSDAELERYSRQMILPQVGGPGQRRLKSARVMIIGAGAIGSAALPGLAAAGIGHLSVIDDDSIDLTNLHRQLIYREDQIGQAKAPAAAEVGKALNSSVEIVPIEKRIVAANAEDLLRGHDLVLDGSDNFATRLAVGDACVRLRIPLVSAAAAQLQAQIALFRGWEHEQPCYRCFVGDAFDADDCDNCAELGVLGPVSAIAGQFGALLAMRGIIGLGDDAAGKLHLLDALTLRWKTIALPKDPGCRTCGKINA
jgi:adenylyltransferase/sulfurtransferase